MSDLVQIVYVSRSTFTTMPAELGIEPSVARILAQSRINNAKRGLVGALYFGDGCFFQCLEGRTADVERLYAALLEDTRHTDLRILTRRPIERTSFATWAMKYVPLDAAMKSLLRELGLEKFDPYRFDEAAVAKVLNMLGTDVDLTPAATAVGHAPMLDMTTRTPGTAPKTRIGLMAALLVALVIAGALVLRAFI